MPWIVSAVAAALLCSFAVLTELKLGELDKLATGRTLLIGEEIVDGAESASELAESMLAEAGRLWSEADGWATVRADDDVTVEAIRVWGDFKKSGLFLWRSRALLTGASARATIEFLATPKGFAVIDPISDPEDFGTYHARYAWRNGSRLEVAEADVDIPFFRHRELAVLNAIDPEEMVFVSKSVLHASKPGGSRYNRYGASAPPNGSVRALNSFAIRATPRGEDACVVEILNYADLCGRFPRRLTNLGNAHFLPGVHARLQAAVGKDYAAPRGRGRTAQLWYDYAALGS
mmetsp:Transcript_15928/g.47505  ORF Transcript_15928/g.47505 Transcript_15928/m.47505 type:complete len:290 (+) Transcript_15928:1249-2118(+)